MSKELIDDGTQHKKLRWPQQQRFIFIRKMLGEEGKFNRAMLRKEFGISLQQAANDIKEIVKREPNLMWYDKSKKCFRPVATSPPEEPSAEEFYQKMFDEIHAALCCNHMTAAVAHFLADLAVRVKKMERYEQ